MNFKYYDILSTLISGCILVLVIAFAIDKDTSEMNSVLLLALAYVLGYVLNAISGLIEPFYYWTMGGMPSDRLLTAPSVSKKTGKAKKYTGCRHIRFYQYEKVISNLMCELSNPNASTREMFERAKAYSSTKTDSRVPDFNSQYAFSRAMLTLNLGVGIILSFDFFGCWWYWPSFLGVSFLLWNRCKERGYYYAREVLVEYLKQNKDGKNCNNESVGS